MNSSFKLRSSFYHKYRGLTLFATLNLDMLDLVIVLLVQASLAAAQQSQGLNFTAIHDFLQAHKGSSESSPIENLYTFFEGPKLQQSPDAATALSALRDIFEKSMDQSDLVVSILSELGAGQPLDSIRASDPCYWPYQCPTPCVLMCAVPAVTAYLAVLKDVCLRYIGGLENPIPALRQHDWRRLRQVLFHDWKLNLCAQDLAGLAFAEATVQCIKRESKSPEGICYAPNNTNAESHERAMLKKCLNARRLGT